MSENVNNVVGFIGDPPFEKMSPERLVEAAQQSPMLHNCGAVLMEAYRLAHEPGAELPDMNNMNGATVVTSTVTDLDASLSRALTSVLTEFSAFSLSAVSN